MRARQFKKLVANGAFLKRIRSLPTPATTDADVKRILARLRRAYEAGGPKPGQ